MEDLVDTGGTAKAILDMYPKAHFVTLFVKQAGRRLVDETMWLTSRKTLGSNSLGVWR